jgi:hypothetical protein
MSCGPALSFPKAALLCVCLAALAHTTAAQASMECMSAVAQFEATSSPCPLNCDASDCCCWAQKASCVSIAITVAGPATCSAQDRSSIMAFYYMTCRATTCASGTGTIDAQCHFSPGDPAAGAAACSTTINGGGGGPDDPSSSTGGVSAGGKAAAVVIMALLYAGAVAGASYYFKNKMAQRPAVDVQHGYEHLVGSPEEGQPR